MMPKFKQLSIQLCLLISLLCSVNPANAVSDLTLHVTDLVSIISTRVTANALNDESQKEFLTALSRLEDELHKDEAKVNTNPFADTAYSEMHLLIKIARNILENQDISFNQRDMLIQQAALIIKKNKELDFTGEDNIRSYHLFAKTIKAEETFSLLSENAQTKLPLKLFNSWWGKTVESVAVKKVDYLGQNQYKVWLLYELRGGKKQCSEDWLNLTKGESGWLIDDFYWNQTSVAYCEKL